MSRMTKLANASSVLLICTGVIIATTQNPTQGALVLAGALASALVAHDFDEAVEEREFRIMQVQLRDAEIEELKQRVREIENDLNAAVANLECMSPTRMEPLSVWPAAEDFEIEADVVDADADADA